MVKIQSALDPEALAEARALLAAPERSDSLAPMAAGAAFFAVSVMALLMTMILMWPISHSTAKPHRGEINDLR